MAKNKKSMGRYVDGYVLVVPKKNVAAYRNMARQGAKLWMKHGALDYKECKGDDLKPDMGPHKLLTFPQMIKLKPTETVWFSYIVYKSKKHRDQVNAKVMKDPAMHDPQYKDKPMPFDIKRMAYGGFTVEISGGD